MASNLIANFIDLSSFSLFLVSDSNGFPNLLAMGSLSVLQVKIKTLHTFMSDIRSGYLSSGQLNPCRSCGSLSVFGLSDFGRFREGPGSEDGANGVKVRTLDHAQKRRV